MSCESPPDRQPSVPSWAHARELGNEQHSSVQRRATSDALLRVQEAAELLQVSEKTIRRLISRGELHVIRIGRLVRIAPDAIAQLIQANPAEIGEGGD